MNRTIRALLLPCAALLTVSLATSNPAAAGTDRGSHRAVHRANLAQWGGGQHRAESTERIRDIRLADITADAWRWFMSLPKGIANDTSGVNCDVNQQGEFWFLGGPIDATYTTDCTVPAGKTIVAFVAAYLSNDIPGDFETDPSPAREYLGAFAAEVIDGISGPAATLNRQSLRVRRVTTGVFPFTAAAYWSEIPDGGFTGSPQIGVRWLLGRGSAVAARGSHADADSHGSTNDGCLQPEDS